MTDAMVQGFVVDSFTIKSDTIKVILKGEKDNIRAGIDDIGGVVTLLEICATAGKEAPINCTLLYNALETTTFQHPFVVVDFVVKQDFIKLKLEAVEVENGTSMEDVAKSLTLHAREREDKPVELALPGTI
ncbi:MAG: hypothetical protein WC516_05435 [Patescibacteria group bacterium]|jgi:hypothetical protein